MVHSVPRSVCESGKYKAMFMPYSHAFTNQLCCIKVEVDLAEETRRECLIFKVDFEKAYNS